MIHNKLVTAVSNKKYLDPQISVTFVSDYFRFGFRFRFKFQYNFSKLVVRIMEHSPNECVPGDGNESNILEVKLSNYKISSHLCNTPAIEKFATFLRCNHDKNPEEISILDMREYGMENIQFQLMIECLMRPVMTNLTSLQLKNNEFDHFCCKVLSDFIKLSVAFESLDFEQIK